MRVLVAAMSSATSADGVGRHAANLVRSLLLRPEIHEVDLVIGAWQEQCFVSLLGPLVQRLNVRVLPIRRYPLVRNLWYLYGLPLLCAELASDLVHVSYPVPLLRSRFPCPVVVTLHDLYPYDVPENFGYPQVFANRWILRRCLTAADEIACVSESTLQRLAVHRPAVLKKACCISNSVDAASGACLADSLEELAGRSFVLVVAQHRRNKNLALSLGIFRRLMICNQKLLLMVVGNEGPETPSLREIVRRHGLHEQVVFAQGLSEERLRWCYLHCALLLATSSCEGFGLPVAEALLAGCPVVCSDIPAFRELGEGWCRFVALTEGAEQAFADAAQSALDAVRPGPALIPRLAGKAVGEAYVQLYRGLLAAEGVATADSIQHELQKGATI